ncbi:MAG TPA: citrate (Si)-synthase [Candidatus Marinimicrobia bacterium]|nr:citrate (Si)-synthase [Candidatus Neomarinimicrobiota bacterium]
MASLYNTLEEKIPVWRDDVESLLKNNGSSVISDVTLTQAYGGMRGVKGLVCDTSSVSPDTGLIIRGKPLLDIIDILPEQVFFLLLADEMPDEDALTNLQSQLSEHAVVPDYIWTILNSMPEDSHPMAMLNTAVLAMEKESVFRKNYDKGMSKEDFWKPMLEDGLSLIAKLPAIGAGVYRIRFQKSGLIEPDGSLDWGANFAHMLGLNDPDGNVKKLMRLYLMLHCDHEGGNASAFTSLTIGSTLSDLYYAVSGGLNALAGPLHGLANQECLKFVLEIRDKFGGAPSRDELEQLCWDRLKNGRVIPGYGHAVLRCPDPRFTAFMNFGKEHIENDDVFHIVETLFDVVPEVLKKHGKAKNPWPNVDAASGALLYHYGLREFSYYTVLFSISRSMGIISQIVINRALGIPIMRPKSVTTKWLKDNC